MIDVAPHNMTGNSTPSPYEATASSFLNSNFAPYRAFDNGAGSAQYWLTNASQTGYIQIKLAAAQTVTSWAIRVNTIPEPNRAPKDFTLQGSNDGSSFTTVDTVTNQTSWTNGQTRTFTSDTPGNYLYYRVDVTANNGDTYLQIAELFLYKPDGVPRQSVYHSRVMKGAA